MNTLSYFLSDPKNSLAREAMFKHRILYDIQVVFASNGQKILCYESEYDRDGFDIILDDLKYQKHIQLKSILKTSQTSSFKIHRNLLRPKIEEMHNYPVSPDSFGLGYGGGVILIQADIVYKDIDITYRYCDGLVLSAFHAGIIKYKNLKQNKAVLNAFDEYSNPNKTGGMVILTKSCFLSFKSLAELLAFSGFQLSLSSNSRTNLLNAIASLNGNLNDTNRHLDFKQWACIAGKELSRKISLHGLVLMK